MLQQFAHGHMVWLHHLDLRTVPHPSDLSTQVWGLLGCPWIPPMRSLHPGPCCRSDDGTVQGSVCRKMSSQFFTASLHVYMKRLSDFCACLLCFSVFVSVSVCTLSFLAVASVDQGRQHRRTFQYFRSNHSLEHPESKLKTSAHIRTWSAGQTSNHGPWTESGIFSGGCSITRNASHVLRELSL